MNIKVKTQTHSYPIYIKSGILQETELPEGSIVITDQNVKKHYGKHFNNYPILVIKPGEKYKRLETIEEMASQLVELGADRDSTLVALGGGVIGDMTGFLAAVYMRGVDFMQIPTTLLAMVDASVGGKTAVDIDAGKNLIGAFHQPDAVVVDPEVLETLPKKEMQNGMAEIIKHGVIDGKLFKWIDKNKEKIMELDKKTMEKLIYQNIIVKKKIVEKDEKEQGIRAALNLGHTFGHALESLSGYKISHGEGVALGMIKAAELANMKATDKLIAMLKDFGLKTSWPKKYAVKDVVKKMYSDKKTKNKKLTLVLPKKFGKIQICEDYPKEEILECLNQ